MVVSWWLLVDGGYVRQAVEYFRTTNNNQPATIFIHTSTRHPLVLISARHPAELSAKPIPVYENSEKRAELQKSDALKTPGVLK